MLDLYLKRKDVKILIDNLVNNNKYFEKKSVEEDLFYIKDYTLFMFYDALIKFKILINDDLMLDDFIEDLDMLFLKINDIESIKLGINKIFVKFVKRKLKLNDEDKEEIIKYVYDKYIINGYLVHGLNSYYVEDIKEYGFSPEEYKNYYEDFIMINDIFKKHDLDNFLDKDFNCKKVAFTDDYILGIVYSINSPGYFYNLLSNNSLLKNSKDKYYNDDYDSCIKNIKNIIRDLNFSEFEKNFVIDVINKEWNLLHEKKKNISLLFVKRNNFSLNDKSLEEYINDDLDIIEIIDSILSSKNSNVSLDKSIGKDLVNIVNIDIVEEKEIIKEKEEEQEEISEEKEKLNEFNNTYGKVSILMLIGTLLICIGVIITILGVVGVI